MRRCANNVWSGWGRAGLACALLLCACSKDRPRRPEPDPEPEPDDRHCTVARRATALYAECEADCDAGSAVACAIAAKMHWGNNRVKGNGAVGVKLAIKACELGSARGCMQAASFFRVGRGIPKDPEREAEYGKRAAAAFTAACDAGDHDACDTLGFWYERAFYVDRDSRRGKALSRRADELADEACDAGDGLACYSLALSYDVAHDSRATGYYRKGCEVDDAESCRALAGELGERSAEGTAALKKSCDLGLGWGCADLATRHIGTPWRLRYEQRACDRDLAFACFSVGVIHQNDDPPNLEEAIIAYRRACRLDEVHCAPLDELGAPR